MVKKSLVFLEFAVILYLGLLIAGQLNLTPRDARLIDRTKPLWFMNPWRPAHLDGGQSDQPSMASQEPQAAGNPAAGGQTGAPAFADGPRPAEGLTDAERDYVLSPAPELNAVIADLEERDVEKTESVLVPGLREKPAPVVRKKAEKPAPKKPAPAGPIRITSLSVVPTASGAILKGFTSSPVERVDLLTTTSPPSMVLELYGKFAAFDGRVSVPQNKIFKAVKTELSPDKMRIIGVMTTTRAYVAPVSTAESQDEFAVEMTLSSAGQPNFELPGGQGTMGGQGQ